MQYVNDKQAIYSIENTNTEWRPMRLSQTRTQNKRIKKCVYFCPLFKFWLSVIQLWNVEFYVNEPLREKRPERVSLHLESSGCVFYYQTEPMGLDEIIRSTISEDTSNANEAMSSSLLGIDTDLVVILEILPIIEK